MSTGWLIAANIWVLVMVAVGSYMLGCSDTWRIILRRWEAFKCEMLTHACCSECHRIYERNMKKAP